MIPPAVAKRSCKKSASCLASCSWYLVPADWRVTGEGMPISASINANLSSSSFASDLPLAVFARDAIPSEHRWANFTISLALAMRWSRSWKAVSTVFCASLFFFFSRSRSTRMPAVVENFPALLLLLLLPFLVSNQALCLSAELKCSRNLFRIPSRKESITKGCWAAEEAAALPSAVYEYNFTTILGLLKRLDLAEHWWMCWSSRENMETGNLEP
mmetsp:Transcript_2133/g.3904  ORF Transcript_2133/g.3904 Transcript_2133/m.3904 type:complete len:215 (-) Transcript_2133:206-850(-)